MAKQKQVGIFLAVVLMAAWGAAQAESHSGSKFELRDVFEVEYASDPQISPDGGTVVYVRNSMDIMSDGTQSHLWIIRSDGSHHRPITSGQGSYRSPRWSPDAKRLIYIGSQDGSSQIYLRWMDTGQSAQLTHLAEGSPGGISWSPDGNQIAFSMFVRVSGKPFVEMPSKPEGANWADPPRVIEKLQYRADGDGYLEDGYTQLFLLPAGGGTPRQLTSGSYNHGGSVSWAPDSRSIIFSANRHPGWEYEPNNSEVYELSLADGALKALTTRKGPDNNPQLSPDGKTIAYLGFDERYQGFQTTFLYLMDRDGSNSRLLTGSFDRSVSQPVWKADGQGIYFSYSDKGNGKIGSVRLDGNVQTLTGNVGGTSLGRPYSSGSYSVASNGRIAFTETRPDHPADVAVAGPARAGSRRITTLNQDLFGHKELAKVEEIWYESSYDQRKIQGWIAYPPGFDSSKKYPLILEIHGGPFANYGDRFAAEIQLYAAAGYLTLYTNPRGSTSYGEEFANLIHHNYPSQDYDDLMSGVDALIARGFVDENNLFVTGGSGGGVLSSWIVGHTDRFRAAVVAKPVINWYSFVLTSDAYNFFAKYWFSDFPWNDPQQYLKRSPLSYVGNVTTPTMLLTGEVDYRTPISESEQFYQALKLRKVDAALVRIPGASHSIARRPSQLIVKVAHVLGWFERYRQ